MGVLLVVGGLAGHPVSVLVVGGGRVVVGGGGRRRGHGEVISGARARGHRVERAPIERAVGRRDAQRAAGARRALQVLLMVVVAREGGSWRGLLLAAPVGGRHGCMAQVRLRELRVGGVGVALGRAAGRNRGPIGTGASELGGGLLLRMRVAARARASTRARHARGRGGACERGRARVVVRIGIVIN